ncbi:MAG: fibronectin type III domain-containing protein, partial [Bacteroidetes bacterium]|nr:fibronectin type III domain-containing protein [Bacteroidota bacterium]
KWTPSPEKNVDHYLVSYQDQSGDWKEITVNEAIATIENVMSNSTIKVKAYNSNGMEGWDWAKIEVE